MERQSTSTLRENAKEGELGTDYSTRRTARPNSARFYAGTTRGN
jgi:hypothetical protein